MKDVKSTDRTTLLLNSAWEPVKVVTAKAAFNHVLRGKTSAIDVNGVVYHSMDTWLELAKYHKDQPCLRGAKDTYPIPTIIIVTDKFFRIPKRKKLSLDEMAKVLDNTCQYCLEVFPKAELTIDHFHPRSKGGDDSYENRILSCVKCNRTKANFAPWYDKNGELPQPPKIPRIIITKSLIRKEWEPFILAS